MPESARGRRQSSCRKPKLVDAADGTADDESRKLSDYGQQDAISAAMAAKLFWAALLLRMAYVAPPPSQY